jgi:hypothetical protein
MLLLQRCHLFRSQIMLMKWLPNFSVIPHSSYRNTLEDKKIPNMEDKIYNLNTREGASWYCKVCNSRHVQDVIRCMLCKIWVHVECAKVRPATNLINAISVDRFRGLVFSSYMIYNFCTLLYLPNGTVLCLHKVIEFSVFTHEHIFLSNQFPKVPELFFR